MGRSELLAMRRKAIHKIIDMYNRCECQLRPVGMPQYVHNTPKVGNASFQGESVLDHRYTPALLSAGAVGEIASSSECVRDVIQVMNLLEPDDYSCFLSGYYQAGLDRFGDNWRYADISTVLFTTSRLLSPTSYLEVGVRRGRSMAMVAAASPYCSLVGFDMWVKDYSGMPNPGPGLVEQELLKVGFKGRAEFINGDSHRTLNKYFKEHPNHFYDLITVDGDHSFRGASQDLKDVLPRLRIGGAIVLDDISQPNLEYLEQVWDRYIGRNLQYSSWKYGELGYGIAVGIRKY